MFTTLNKAATVLFWILALCAWSFNWGAQPELEWVGLLPQLALVIFGIHILEAGYFFAALKKYSDNPGKDAAQILVFGIFHMQKFIKLAAQ